MNIKTCEYGVGDCSYKMAGELSGITQLVNAFYDNMDALKEAENIRSMHSKDLSASRKKLTYFLSGWLGGPKLYAENFGSINIPQAHKHLHVGIASMIEQYIDSMEISSEKMDKIVQMAAEIYGQIKATGNAPDGESLALTLYLVANQAAEKKPHDPYEFAGYA